jgi:uncharacterized protein
MTILINLIAGIVFAVGLIIAGMTNPTKILNFLDIAGTFDPSLAFVLGGAVVTASIGYRLAWKRERPFLAPAFATPAKPVVDRYLIAGAALFGLGWGLSGFCPGPALASIAQGAAGTLAFVAAMLGGMVFARNFSPR